MKSLMRLIAAASLAVLTLPAVEVATSSASASATVVGGSPAGCPRTRFCGCASAKYVGISGAGWNVNLAANWLGLSSAAPAPGMAAARRGHVFIIKQVLGNGKVLAYDPNSGGHKTRIHVRSLAGYRVVNPHSANRYASTMYASRKVTRKARYAARASMTFAWWQPWPQRTLDQAPTYRRGKVKRSQRYYVKRSHPRARYAIRSERRS